MEIARLMMSNNDLNFITLEDVEHIDCSNIFKLNGNLCHNEKLFFIHMKSQFSFPDWFGMNWNALYDLLTNIYLNSDSCFVIYNFEQFFLNDNKKEEQLTSFKELLVDIKDWFENKSSRGEGSAINNPEINFNIYVVL